MYQKMRCLEKPLERLREIGQTHFHASAFQHISDVESTDVNKEREPVREPTPLTFPEYIPKPASISDKPYNEFINLFNSIRKPSDITAQYAEALGISIHANVDIQDLVPPSRPDGTSYIPPLPIPGPPGPLQPITSGDPKSVRYLMANGRPAPNLVDFETRVSELMIENDEAWRVVQRRPPPEGKPRRKLAYFRSFFEKLLLMAQYWDSSADNYYTIEDEEAANDSNPTRSKDENAMEVDGEEKHTRLVYKGRRLGNGTEMPEIYREDAVIAFIQGIVYAFGCSVSQPRLPPRLALNKTLFPVRQTAVVYRLPNDRQQARRGILEGPVMVIQCRPEISFQSEGEKPGEAQAERLDLLREVASSLLTAQERSRDGHTEVKPGEGQWWTTAPRWGGGSGGEVGNPNGNSDEASKVGVKEGSKESTRVNKRSRWEALKPPMELWDRRVRYQRIGVASGDVDDVYMVSSLNHHISIIHFRVPFAYMEYLTSGEPPSHPPSPDWGKLDICRSRWFDLLSPSDRSEAFQALWGITAYLMGKADEKVEK
ncbi:MAG: hypothetical protein M1834_007318 [Cirrosporium novae-zelandiae]|nr:MAG: hypothetical protein M1834_007318 [Cirrosporium novae-zelandiae]